MRVVQLPLQGTGGQPIELQVRPIRSTIDTQPLTSELEDYRDLLVATDKDEGTVEAYIYQLRSLLEAAQGYDSLIALFLDPTVLGRALVNDRSKYGRQLSRWTLAQRRSAIRSFARMMGPQLKRLTGRDPLEIIVEALRLSSERVGIGFRLTGGVPRRRGGPHPSPDEVAAITREAARAPGFEGHRNLAFFWILFESGSRVNALREVSCADLVELPMGGVRLQIHAKGKSQRREIELTRHSWDLLRTYIEQFNCQTATSERIPPIVIGERTPLWRGTGGGLWPYNSVSNTFQGACLNAGTQAYILHSLRRAFASQAAAFLPRHTVALSGGWSRTRRMDDHYIRAQPRSVEEKLSTPLADSIRILGNASSTSL